MYDAWRPELIAKPAHGLDVGYLPSERALELSGYLEPDEHVALGEHMTVRALLEAGQTAGGHPLGTVRVIFADHPMALCERVPLLDAGAEVWHVDRDGRQRPA